MLITFEGIDCSGKGTQSKRLAAAMEEMPQMEGRVKHIAFPRYKQTFGGELCGEYLRGSFGSLDQTHPMLTSFLYAIDRYETLPMLEDWLAQDIIVISDRYVESNIAHQTAKAKTVLEQAQVASRIAHLEYQILQLPRPDRIIYLDVSVHTSTVRNRGRRGAADIHERDKEYLAATRKCYQSLMEKEPQRWFSVAGDARSQEEIAIEILELTKLYCSPAET